ncbi:putative nodulation protein L [Polychaeton citri CBS 116435]|uniref:Nodulation protein L n=1 Tax=Polychaeton citri CBS 116435 TaxID=1314669 RepID=A0A9P4PY61_9PEZI|nr:putative nodulation protein L [Polychaeton citri CBS 116435]
MLVGKPFLQFTDRDLLADRVSCKTSLQYFNDAHNPTTAGSPSDKARLFSRIVDPGRREKNADLPMSQYHSLQAQPKGHVGVSVIVDAPFNCDYGYNIRLSDRVVVQSGAYFQDAATISVGERTIIGPNVKLYTITSTLDPSQRKGSQGTVYAGSIKIEEDCFIGADVIILPFRTIHRGATVGAGSVVTKDVPPNTVYAGNPAREIRSINPGQKDPDKHKRQIEQENSDMLHAMRAELNFQE